MLPLEEVLMSTEEMVLVFLLIMTGLPPFGPLLTNTGLLPFGPPLLRRGTGIAEPASEFLDPVFLRLGVELCR